MKKSVKACFAKAAELAHKGDTFFMLIDRKGYDAVLCTDSTMPNARELAALIMADNAVIRVGTLNEMCTLYRGCLVNTGTYKINWTVYRQLNGRWIWHTTYYTEV